MKSINCFKSYDVRGKLGQELNESIAYKIGNGFARYLDAKRIVIGGDVYPKGKVESHFINGDAAEIFNDILPLFQNADFCRPAGGSYRYRH